MTMESMRVDSIMTKGLKTTKSSESVREVASIMDQNYIGSVIITENQNNFPVGISPRETSSI